jgi:hypothetical protein
VVDAVDVEVVGECGVHEGEGAVHPCVAGRRVSTPARVDLVTHVEADDVLMRGKGATKLADEEGLGVEHDGIGEKSVGEAVEWREEIPAAELAGEDGNEGIELALGHERDELIEALEVRWADPFGVGLEEGPDEEDAHVVGAQSGDGIEIAADSVGVPVVPAEPPIVRGGVIDAEAVAGQVETGSAR